MALAGLILGYLGIGVIVAIVSIASVTFVSNQSHAQGSQQNSDASVNDYLRLNTAEALRRVSRQQW